MMPAPHADAAAAHRALFVELVEDFCRAATLPPVELAPVEPVLTVKARCGDVDFLFEHALSRRPVLMRVGCEFGRLPQGERRLPALHRLLQLQHASVPFETCLGVVPGSGVVLQTIALPLARVTLASLRQSMVQMRACALEWRSSGFLGVSTPSQVALKGRDLVSPGLMLARVH